MQAIPRRQGAFTHHAKAVDQGAVRTGEIPHQSPLAGDAQQAVLPADPVAVGPHVTFGTASEEEIARWKVKSLAAWLAFDDEQLNVHERSLRPKRSPAMGGTAGRLTTGFFRE